MHTTLLCLLVAVAGAAALTVSGGASLNGKSLQESASASLFPQRGPPSPSRRRPGPGPLGFLSGRNPLGAGRPRDRNQPPPPPPGRGPVGAIRHRPPFHLFPGHRPCHRRTTTTEATETTTATTTTEASTTVTTTTPTTTTVTSTTQPTTEPTTETTTAAPARKRRAIDDSLSRIRRQLSFSIGSRRTNSAQVIPSIKSMIDSIPNLRSLSGISVPKIAPMTNISTLPSNLRDIVENARKYALQSIGGGEDFRSGLQQAMDRALDSDDPEDAIDSLLCCIIDAYCFVAEHCPLLAGAVCLIDECLAICSDVAGMLSNISFGASINI